MKGLNALGEEGIIEEMQERETGSKRIPPASAFWQGEVMPSFIHSFIQLSNIY